MPMIPRLVQRGEPGVVGHEGGAVNAGAQGEIAVQRFSLQRGRHIAARVLKQGVQVPRRVGAHRVLEVDHADAGRAVAPGQPDQVLGVIVAVRHDRGARRARSDDGRPGRAPVGDGGVIERHPIIQLRQPFDEQIGPALQRRLVIGQQRPVAAWAVQGLRRRSGLVQDSQGLDGGQIQRRLVGAVFDHAGEQVIAEILQHGQTVGRIQRRNIGRGQA